MHLKIIILNSPRTPPPSCHKSLTSQLCSDCLHYPDVLCRTWPRPPTQRSLLGKSWIGQNINMTIWSCKGQRHLTRQARLPCSEACYRIQIICYQLAVWYFPPLQWWYWHNGTCVAFELSKHYFAAKLCRLTCDSVTTCHAVSRVLTQYRTDEFSFSVSNASAAATLTLATRPVVVKITPESMW